MSCGSSQSSCFLCRCAELLDSCQFAQFWTLYKTLESNESLLPMVESGTDRLCQSIATVLALSYRTAPLSVVTSALHTDNVAKYVESVNGDTVSFPATPDNTKRGRVFQEGVTFTEIATLMSKTRAAKE
jgi:CSN8/PSMD8/EIF3K family